MVPHAVTSSMLTVTIFSILMSPFLQLGARGSDTRLDDQRARKRTTETVLDCVGPLPPFFSRAGVRNYPIGYDTPYLSWGTLKAYCAGWRHDQSDPSPGGAGCRCVIPGYPWNAIVPMGQAPDCHGGNRHLPGYDWAAFDTAPATEICRRSCTCDEEPQVVPNSPKTNPESLGLVGLHVVPDYPR